ncbi:MAG: ATPase [Candidatus Kaiserbacteria bacterium]|nr:ATPase [Candidatus Kaiserbacteria bacterium]
MLQSTALKVLQTGLNVFLTGEPGSGKTHTINAYVEWLRERGVEPAITASTGIAATHIHGMTIHSWSGIGIKKFLTEYELDAVASSKRVIDHVRTTQVLIIDEVSMLSADTLTMVDQVCREVRKNSLPFGGMQVILVGDFFQLPPVVRRNENQYDNLGFDDEGVSPFAFRSPAWEALNPVVCYLHEQHRQSDAVYTQLLTALRRGVTENDAIILDGRIVDEINVPADIPRLFSRNMSVDTVNSEKLRINTGVEEKYEMFERGPAHMTEALKRGCMSPETLYLKIGAKVMFTKNDPAGRFVNGTLGEVEAFSKAKLPIVRTRDGRTIEVEATEWKLDDGGKTLARITQIPLRLAWAITVHKSQGMTLDAAVIDLRDAFEYGQGYVALSRVRSLDGLTLLGYNERALEVHPEALAQDIAFKKNSAIARAKFETMPESEHQKLVENFINAIGGSLEFAIKTKKSKKPKKEKPDKAPTKVRGDSIKTTLTLLKAGKSIQEVADMRTLSPTTIVGHIRELYMQGDLDKKDIQELVSPALAEYFDEVAAIFETQGTEKLAPIFNHFQGALSYEDLHIARLLCL